MLRPSLTLRPSPMRPRFESNFEASLSMKPRHMCFLYYNIVFYTCTILFALPGGPMAQGAWICILRASHTHRENTIELSFPFTISCILLKELRRILNTKHYYYFLGSTNSAFKKHQLLVSSLEIHGLDLKASISLKILRSSRHLIKNPGLEAKAYDQPLRTHKNRNV